MLYLKKMLQLVRMIGLPKDLISNWLLIYLYVNCLRLIYRQHWRDGPCNHWNVAIFRKIRVDRDVLRAT